MPSFTEPVLGSAPALFFSELALDSVAGCTVSRKEHCVLPVGIVVCVGLTE